MAFDHLLRLNGVLLLTALLIFCFSTPAFTQQVTIADDANIVSERRLQLSNTDFTRLLNARVNERVTLDFTATAERKKPLWFQRINLYAPGAQIIVSDGISEQVMEKSNRRFFLATDAHRSAGFSLDPATGKISGLLIEGVESYRITSEQKQNRALDTVIMSSLREENERSVFSCENDAHPDITTRYRSRALPGMLPSLKAMPRGAGVLYEATIAIDTDNEFLWNNFANNENDARDWVEELFVKMNVIFERDLSLRLLLGTTILREDNSPSGNPNFDADPADFNAGLDQFSSYWAVNQRSVNRVFTALLSGKNIGSLSFSGVAWIDGYCDNNYGYSFNQIGRNLSTAFVAGGVGHEIGHNLGSLHTHCEKLANNGTDFVDRCFAGENTGCYNSTPQCPAGGVGTLMSYCHLSPGGCSSSNVFHPLIIGKLDNRIIANTPACIGEISSVGSGVILSDNFEN